jgi:hypothetical protein
MMRTASMMDYGIGGLLVPAVESNQMAEDYDIKQQTTVQTVHYTVTIIKRLQSAK